MKRDPGKSTVRTAREMRPPHPVAAREGRADEAVRRGFSLSGHVGPVLLVALVTQAAGGESRSRVCFLNKRRVPGSAPPFLCGPATLGPLGPRPAQKLRRMCAARRGRCRAVSQCSRPCAGAGALCPVAPRVTGRRVCASSCEGGLAREQGKPVPGAGSGSALGGPGQSCGDGQHRGAPRSPGGRPSVPRRSPRGAGAFSCSGGGRRSLVNSRVSSRFTGGGAAVPKGLLQPRRENRTHDPRVGPEQPHVSKDCCQGNAAESATPGRRTASTGRQTATSVCLQEAPAPVPTALGSFPLPGASRAGLEPPLFAALMLRACGAVGPGSWRLGGDVSRVIGGPTCPHLTQLTRRWGTRHGIPEQPAGQAGPGAARHPAGCRAGHLPE